MILLNKSNEKKGFNIGSALSVLCCAVLLFFFAAAIISMRREGALDKELQFYLHSDGFSQEATFLSNDNVYEQELKELILNSFSYKINNIERQGSTITFDLKGQVISFASAIAKKYPSLFSYSRTDFFQKEISSKTDDEYLKEIIDTLKDEMTSQSGSLTYSFNISLSATVDGNKYVISPHPDLENQLLGNIYSYQNDNCRFLSFDELVFPDGRAEAKTSQTSVSAIFGSPVPATTFSSEDFPIEINDEANILFGQSDEVEKSLITLSVKNISLDNSNNMIVSMNITSEKDISVSPTMFYSYSGNNYDPSITNDTLLINSKLSQYQLKFKSKEQFVVFAPYGKDSSDKIIFSTSE